MKYFLALICIILSAANAQSQTYEIGVALGGANFIGDVGSTNYVSPNSLAMGAIFKWNRSERHSFRFSALTTKLSGDDANSHEIRRQERSYSFQNNVTELSLGLEYTFWEFNMFGGNRASTPYLYSGFTYLFYDSLKLNTTNATIEKYGSSGDFAIPMVVGFKTSVSTNMIVAFEIGARYVLSDSIDGSSSPDKDYISNSFGNTNNNDWYVFTGITFSFTFGRQPCYCNF